MTAAPRKQLNRLVCGMVALGAAVLLTAGVVAAAGPPPPLLALGLVAAATLALESVAVTVRIGHQNETYTWAEVVVVVGLALLAPAVLVLTALCVGVANLVAGREPVKVLFNTSSHAVGLALAAAVTHLIGTPDWDHPVRSAAALAAGAATFSVWNSAAVSAAIAFSQQLPFTEVHRRNAGLRRLVMVGNIVLVLSGLALAQHRPELVAVLPFGLAVAYLAYRAYRGLLLEREVWRHLQASSRELSALDQGEIAAVAVPRTAALLQADLVELTLFGAAGEPATVHAGASSGPVHVRAIRHEDAIDGTTEATSVVVPLHGRGAAVGQLRLRFGAPVRLSRREQQLLDDHAATLSAHLDNARLYAAVQRQAAREAEAARHDALTGLPNRLLLEERGEAAARSRCAVLLIDLDRFKQVNDTHGHAAGDRLLCALAGRLRSGVRPGDTVCRLGGDEFAVLLADVEAAEPTARRLTALLSEPVDVGGVLVQVGASVGIAVAEPGGTFADVLAHADRAMYQSKGQRSAARCQSREDAVPAAREEPPLRREAAGSAAAARAGSAPHDPRGQGALDPRGPGTLDPRHTSAPARTTTDLRSEATPASPDTARAVVRA